MNPPSKTVSVTFYIAAIYDGVLGIVFLISPQSLLRSLGVPEPPLPGYIQFPAALLVVFAIMFLAIARRPVRNRSLIPYGILLKASYCGVVFWYWAFDSISNIWKPFAVFDLIFLLLFLWLYAELGKAARES